MLLIIKEKFIPLVFICILLAGCNRNDPVELVNGFYSYTSAEELEQQIGVDKSRWKIIENSNYSTDTLRYHYLTYAIPDYNFLNMYGEIYFHYFNDRLLKIDFFPYEEDEEKFIKIVKTKVSTILNKTNSEITRSNTIIRLSVNFENRIYLSFSDKRLEKELDAWIKEHS